ncbi:DegT/DnrJ/EryC1/StrS family aminotransferase, partial [Streptomyces sp. x-80]|uniref:DegT/DnrJ/EryC1/StrS family aminotransferase n=1 Tax=Streptomyces sp. x-80 TaxID=2789282 RepID=UPI00397FB052
MAGRCADLARLTAYCADRDLRLLEDACQAQGTRYDGSPAVHLGPDPAPEGAVLICGALGPEAAAALLRGPAAVVSTTGG